MTGPRGEEDTEERFGITGMDPHRARKPELGLHSNWRWAALATIAIGLSLALRAVVIDVFQVASDSMIPAILPGDYVLVNRLAYQRSLPCPAGDCSPDARIPSRGDVVVFSYPGASEKRYVKRVIGLPGETITYTDDRLNINGTAAHYSQLGTHHFTAESAPFATADAYLEQLPGHGHRILERPEPLHAKGSVWKVPPRHVFVLGDNRDRSNDSRFLGPVSVDRIDGRAIRVLWSWDEDHRNLRLSRILASIQ